MIHYFHVGGGGGGGGREAGGQAFLFAIQPGPSV